MNACRRALARPFLFLLSVVLVKQASCVFAAADANQLAHELFGPTINALTVDAKISGPEGAISQYSSKDSDIKTGSKSGVAFKTGGGASSSAPGDESLSQLIGQPTAEAATLTVQFRPTFPRKTIRLKITMVSEENADRLQHGFDDVFAASLDGKMIAFVTAADTKEPTDQQKAENPNAPRTVTLSEPMTISNAQLHLLKISIASVGDANGPSTAIVSFEGEAELETYFPIVAAAPPAIPELPETPVDPEPFKKAAVPPWKSAPPTPPEMIQRGDPVPVPDRTSSLVNLLIGSIFLALLSNRKSQKAA